MDRSEIFEALESSEFFRGLDRKDIEKIAGLCRDETFQPGQVIIRQGDTGDHVYIIAEGQVTLERTVDLGTRKGNVVIGIIGKGRAFGCWSTLLGISHSFLSSASCQKPTKAVLFNGTEIRALMLSNPALGFCILERLCFFLRDRLQSVYGAMERI
ncbi:MAG: cyclic nucleotide-binding domain-containing protein [Desulfobacteraceae bacterium]|nr:MAG: cyclic nucleotide-binding domain-containing protein [Desulfobacteraceae bacterium]